MALGTLDSHMQKMKLDHYLTPFTKINSKEIKDLITSPEAIKFLQENTENKILDTSLCDDFLDLAPKAKGTRVKTSSCDDIRLKSFCPIKETINKVKKQPMELEKIFAYYISGKDYYPKYTRNSYNSVSKNNLIFFKWAENLNRFFYFNFYFILLYNTVLNRYFLKNTYNLSIGT